MSDTNPNPQILIIAGVDPTGNAGLLKDIKVCESHGLNHIACPTAQTIQTDDQFTSCTTTTKEDIESIFNQLPESILAVKIGMLANKKVVQVIIDKLKKLKERHPSTFIVWDPVLASSSGGELLTKEGLELAKQDLLPLLSLITPNSLELETLSGTHSNCESFFKTYHTNIYLKGGHSKNKSTDFLFQGDQIKTFTGTVSQNQIRGTGCFFSTQLACHIAKGYNLEESCYLAKEKINALFKLSEA